MLFKKSFLLLILSVLLSGCGGGSSSFTNSEPDGSDDINSGSFDGLWFGPCVNNNFNYSARQTITLSGTSLISAITSYTGGQLSSLDCTIPSQGIIVDSDVTATLTFGAEKTQSECVNSTGIETTITPTQFLSSGNEATTQPDLNDGVLLVTGSRNDFLPDSTNICLKTNGNLLFAGHEYTKSTNTSIVTATDGVIVSNGDVTWKLGDNSYNGGTSVALFSSINNSTVDNFGVLEVTTIGFDRSNGDFSGSGVSIAHSLQGSGSYTIEENTTDLITSLSNKVITLTVTAGTINSPLAATSYKAISGTVEVTVDNNGKYHFSIVSPITLTKAIDVGTGVPNAPDTFSFTMNNIYDFNN
ncbi:MAG: hypothetical protein V3U71_02495 [Cocleimonas sp.]